MEADGRTLNSLIQIASELFRFKKVFERVLAQIRIEDQNKYYSQYTWFEKKVLGALQESGLKMVDVRGRMFDPGLPVTAINIDEFGPEEELYVQEMIEPIIMQGDDLVKTGVVLLGKME